MPITTRTLLTGAQAYAPVFDGTVEHTAQIAVNITLLTNAEIDSLGYLKPGVPFTSGGVLVTSPRTKSTIAQGTNVGTGDGTIGAATGGYGMPTETITATFTTTGATAKADVVGTKSGYIGQLTVGSAFASQAINVTVSDGANDYTAGDVITWAVTKGVSDVVFGVSIEPIKVAAGNAAGDISAASAAFEIGLGIAGVVRKKLAEANLGRSYTAAEVAGFANGNITLLA